jgi:hypothetical protein
VKTILAVVLATALSVFSAETPDQLRDKGFEALKASQVDETKTVEAARLLAQAAEAYEKAGNEDAASELNSYLYWCKKKMTLEQTETFAKTGDSGRRIAAKLDEVATRKVEPSDVGKWLEQAETFAKAHPNDPLLCAIRYFEVADRFVGAQESLIAQRKSLDLMGKTTPKVRGTFDGFSFSVKQPSVVGVVDAAVGQQWYMRPGGSALSLKDIPAYLKGAKMLQQAGHPWITEISSSRPLTLYVAVRVNWENGNAISDRDFEDGAIKSGWSVRTESISTGGAWRWATVSKNLSIGKTSIECPWPKLKTAVIFFVSESAR